MKSWRTFTAPLVVAAAITLLGMSACQKSDESNLNPAPSGPNFSETPGNGSSMGAPAQPRSSNPSAP